MSTAEQYEPRRSSVRADRARILNSIAELEQRHAEAASKAEYGDPSYTRLKFKLRKQVESERQKLAQFDERHQTIEAAEKSDDAFRAWQRANKSAIAFERDLTKLAKSAAKLKEAGAEVARTIKNRDMGVWPSRRLIDEAIRGRVLDSLGDIAQVRLPGYGSSGKRAVRLDQKFSKPTGGK